MDLCRYVRAGTLWSAGLGWMVGVLPAQSLRPEGPWQVERVTRGDTTVVRTLAGSTWGPVRLVEHLRIGSRDGDGVDAFGFIQCLTVLWEGSVALFDGTVPALRIFSPDGRHVRTLGRDGAGPGEYRNQCLGLAVHPDGTLLMYDPRNARLNRYAPDGEVLPSWRVPAGFYGQQNLWVDTAGNTYVKVTTERPHPGEEWKIGDARLDRSGTLRDTLPPPVIPGDAAGGAFFSPRKLWVRTRDAGLVAGLNAGYALTVSGPGRRPVRIERVSPQVRLDPAERRNYQEVDDARRQNPMVRTSETRTAVPALKPFYKAVWTDDDGKIWVSLHTPGERYDPPPPPPPAQGIIPPPPIRWRERNVFDVFQPDGTYLGQVEFPGRTTPQAARGDLVWATQRGEDDEQYVVRYRMVRAGR